MAGKRVCIYGLTEPATGVIRYVGKALRPKNAELLRRHPASSRRSA